MSKIGTLKSVKNGAHEELHGEIKTMQMQVNVRFIPDHLKLSDNAPDYDIRTEGGVNIGAAWEKTKVKAGGDKFTFLSITIDDPSMPQPLNVAAFKKDDGTWDITWRRRQANSQNQSLPFNQDKEEK